MGNVQATQHFSFFEANIYPLHASDKGMFANASRRQGGELFNWRDWILQTRRRELPPGSSRIRPG